MSYYTPTFDGNSMFGQAVTITAKPVQRAVQNNQFFGIDGISTLSAGTRGKLFTAKGIFVAASVPEINAIVDLWETYNDGFAYVLIDTKGKTHSNVQFRGELEQDDRGLCVVAGGGWGLEYKIMLYGLD